VELGVKDQVDYAIKNMRWLIKAGVRVLPGGDYGFIWNPVGKNARDIEHFVRHLDMSPMEAIIAATKLGGELIGMGEELGQVKEGFLADLILVDGDPLSDVSILQDHERIICVMKDGNVEKMTMNERRTPNYRQAV
jgi:imidazolonepropionase-like amidohydrolase